MFRTASRGFPLVEVRGDAELRRLRGACLEGCWKHFAVTENNNTKPVFFRFQQDKGQPWEERSDVDVLELVGTSAATAYDKLEQLGYSLVYAQSTYKRTNLPVTENAVETRSQSEFSVDVTVRKNAREVWLETEWSDAQQLPTNVARAKSKLGKYKFAANEAKKYPQRWKLDDNLSGGYLKPPDAFGTLVVGVCGFRLQVGDNEPVFHSFGDAPVVETFGRTRHRQREALWQKNTRQRQVRSSNRETLTGSKRRVQKKPAAQAK